MWACVSVFVCVLVCVCICVVGFKWWGRHIARSFDRLERHAARTRKICQFSCLSITRCLSVLCVCLSVCVSVFLCVCLCVCLALCLCVSLSVCHNNHNHNEEIFSINSNILLQSLKSGEQIDFKLVVLDYRWQHRAALSYPANKLDQPTDFEAQLRLCFALSPSLIICHVRLSTSFTSGHFWQFLVFYVSIIGVISGDFNSLATSKTYFLHAEINCR